MFTNIFAQYYSAHPVDLATTVWFRFGGAPQEHGGFTHQSSTLAALPEAAEISSGYAANVAKV